MSTEKTVTTKSFFAVPLKNNESLDISLDAGETLFILGPNGAGKSSLLYNWAKNNRTVALVPGNREIIFGSSAVSISASQAAKEENWGQTSRIQADARVQRTHHNNENRLNRLLFQLKSLSEDINKRYRQAHREGRCDELAKLDASEPIELINQGLKCVSIPLKLDWTEKSELKVNKDGYDGEFGVHQMSDGERAALILMGEAILANKDAAILIDEPERHLHRSISSPLLRYLVNTRPDLRWVIATHDLSLPRDDGSPNILVMYKYFGDMTWQAELVSDIGNLPSSVSEAIYGARHKVLFVEGKDQSRDYPLYQQIFDGVTIVPVGTCLDVRDAIAGLKNVPNLHHMESKGLVDGDNREDAEDLRESGIATLSVYAIESVYYHPDVIEQMLKWSAEKISITDVLNKATNSLGDLGHLAKMSAYRTYREKYLRAMLDDNTFATSIHEQESINGPKLIADAKEDIDGLAGTKNWLDLVKKYKIKATNAPKSIANILGFAGPSQYERCVIKMLDSDAELRKVVLEIVPNPFDRT